MSNKGLFVAALLMASVPAFGDVPYNVQCAPLHGVVGKDYFDYLDPLSKPRIDIVEQYHFTPEIESLSRGLTGYIPDELAFVLRALPNHYRALSAMGRWQLQHPKMPDSLLGRVDTADCYFKRAISFRSDDPTLHLIYGIFLHKSGSLALAEQEYTRAEELGGAGAELFYNRGLLKLQLGDIASAQAYADKAYALGYPLPGLHKLLIKAQANSKH